MMGESGEKGMSTCWKAPLQTLKDLILSCGSGSLRMKEQSRQEDLLQKILMEPCSICSSNSEKYSNIEISSLLEEIKEMTEFLVIPCSDSLGLALDLAEESLSPGLILFPLVILLFFSLLVPVVLIFLELKVSSSWLVLFCEREVVFLIPISLLKLAWKGLLLESLEMF